MAVDTNTSAPHNKQLEKRKQKKKKGQGKTEQFDRNKNKSIERTKQERKGR